MKKAPDSKLGDSVKQLRESRAWSQDELAKATGISRVTISHIETGRVRPKLATLVAIGEALGMDAKQILYEGTSGFKQSHKTDLRRIQQFMKNELDGDLQAVLVQLERMDKRQLGAVAKMLELLVDGFK